MSSKNIGYGKLEVTYIPKHEGNYIIEVTYNDRHVIGSPFCSISKLSYVAAEEIEVFGEGLTSGEVGKPVSFTLRAVNVEVDKLQVDINGPSKPTVTYRTISSSECQVTYAPLIVGMYSIDMAYDGKPVARSPYKTEVKASSLVSKVKIYGDGLTHGVVGKPSTFVVDTTKSGLGKLDYNIIGPCKPDVSLKKLSLSKSEVTFIPFEVGVYAINITFNNEQIPGSPFSSHIAPARDSPPSKQTTHAAEKVENDESLFGRKKEPIIKTENAPLQESINDAEAPSSVTYSSATTPTECLNNPVFKCSDTGLIVFGAGLESAICEKVTEFCVDASEASPGKLDFVVHGLGGTTIPVSVEEIDEKRFKACYIPSEAGKYFIKIKYNELPLSFGDIFVIAESIPDSQVCSLPCVNMQDISDELHAQNTGERHDRPINESLDLVTNASNPYGTLNDVPDTATWCNSGMTDEMNRQVSVDDTMTSQLVAIQSESPNPISEFSVNKSHAHAYENPVVRPVDTVTENMNECENICAQLSLVDRPSLFSSDSIAYVQEPVEKTIFSKNDHTETLDESNSLEIISQKDSLEDLQVEEVQVETSKFGFDSRATPCLGAQETLISPTHTQLDECSVESQILSTDNHEIPLSKLVNVSGSCLKNASVNHYQDFIVDMSKSGPGTLRFSVTSPSKPELKAEDLGNNLCRVTFMPKEIGSYIISVMYNGEHVLDSPFNTYATLDDSLDLPDSPVQIPRRPDVFMDSTTDFTVDASSVSPSGDGKVKAIITGPSGTKSESLVKDNDDGTYKVAFSPFEEGPHQMDVTYDGVPIPGSPLEVNVVPGNDPSRVKAYGPGLEKGITNVPQQFVIETRGAGQGGLALAVEGPSKAQVNCTDNRDGTCTVDYVPTKPGDYDITVKFADQDIPGSPFKVPVEDKIDPSKVRMHGSGLNPEGVRATQPAVFTIDCTDAGKAPLKAVVDDGTGSPKPLELVEVDDGVFDCTYYPTQEGAPCRLDVTYDDEHVPGSPFEQTVLPPHDASLVTVSGPGIEDGVAASLPTEFTVDTSKAGVADLDVAVQAPDGQYLRPTITDNKDATVTVHYTPEDVGKYKAKVKYGGDPIPGSPFDVNTKPSGDASKCQITGLYSETPCLFYHVIASGLLDLA
ncbi:FLNB [Bugula neritina]|uniref:FLNB n=1 Tax=Bugula neritina TaxID=10212 RepID=A0A7J7J1C5_BUGNE|nr:FLNB [Bugula neritina]